MRGSQSPEFLCVFLLECCEECRTQRPDVRTELASLLYQISEPVDRRWAAKVGKDAAKAQALRHGLDQSGRVNRGSEECKFALHAVDVLAVADLEEAVGRRVPPLHEFVVGGDAE